MANKMGRIFSASRYAGALDAYIDYIKNMDRRGARVGEGDPRPPKQDLWIEPFGMKLATDILVKTRSSEPSWVSIGPALATRTIAALPGGKTELTLKGYKPPRVILKTGITATGVKKISNRTKMKYLSYGGKSLSAPFGRASGTDTIALAFTAIRTSLKPNATDKDRQVYLVNEEL